jgi:iron complex outermembrane recepter protein
MSLCVILPLMAAAQKNIKGKVFDAVNDKPLALASITVKEGTVVIITDDDGTFAMQIDSAVKTIVVSYAGYTRRSVKVKGIENTYLIGMQPLQAEAEIIVIKSKNLSRTKVQTAVPVDIIPFAAMANEVGQTGLNQLLAYAAPSFQSSRQAVAHRAGLYTAGGCSKWVLIAGMFLQGCRLM